jgi:hypothetical protein
MPPLNRKFRLTIPVRGKQPVQAPTAVTKALDEVWSKVRSAKDGQALDDALAELGQASIERDRVVWQPPRGLSANYADHLSKSVAELNRLIETGVMEIDADGNIKPVGL